MNGIPAHFQKITDRLFVDPRVPWGLRKDGRAVDMYTLPFTVAGLQLAWDMTPGLRDAGYQTRVIERTLCGFPVYTLLAYHPLRPSRKERLHGFNNVG